MAYSIQQLLADVKSLGIGNSFSYVNSDQKICKLDAVDDGQQRISFTFTNNTTTPPTVENGNFTQDKLLLVANALSAGNAINIDAVLNGGGNKRAVLESFLAHTEHVFVCYVNGAKHIFWSPQHLHAVGKMCYFAPGVALEKYMPASQMETEFKQWLVQQPSRGQSGLFGASPASMYCNGLKTCLQDPVFAKVFVKNLFEVQDAACFEVLVNTIKKVPGYSAYNLGWNNQALNAAMGKYKKYLDTKVGVMSVTGNGNSALNSGLDAFLAAIRTKPFILLAGISGTGKSRLVRQLAKGCCKADSELAHGNEPGNFASIAVRPNWHDSTELIGYVSRLGAKPRYVITDFVRFLAKAWLYEDTPFFLCLDEMNLAPVEQYFAEYLSVVESRSRNGENKIESDVLIKWTDDEIREGALEELFGEDASPNVTLLKAKIDADKGLRLSPNLIVMGTVNMDETTFSFSRKVLDRAMSFELNEVDMDAGLQQCNDVEYGSILADSAKASLIKGCEAYAVDQALCDKVKSYLIAINERLDGTSFKIAYRTRDEMMIYCIERTKGGLVGLVQALDEATSMKILSRIEGDTDRITEAKLTSFRNLIVSELLKVDGKAGSDAEVVEFLGNAEKVKASACCTKLNQMIKTVHDGAGFVSFWQC